MSPKLYHQVRQWLAESIEPRIKASSLDRLTLLVIGIIKAEHASPARVAKALDQLGLSQATAESIERRIRRIENDPSLAIVFTQMTKASVSASFGGGDDVADFHLSVIDNHPVNQQFHQFSFLVKGGLGQSLLDPLTESFNRRSDSLNLHVF